MHQFTSYLYSVVHSLSTADLIVIAGGLAVAIQYLINHFVDLKKPVQWLISFPLPSFTALLVLGSTYGHFNLVQGSLAYMAAQVIYFTVETLKARGVKNVLDARQSPELTTVIVPNPASTTTNF